MSEFCLLTYYDNVQGHEILKSTLQTYGPSES
jgi:hypothetical protein